MNWSFVGWLVVQKKTKKLLLGEICIYNKNGARYQDSVQIRSINLTSLSLKTTKKRIERLIRDEKLIKNKDQIDNYVGKSSRLVIRSRIS